MTNQTVELEYASWNCARVVHNGKGVLVASSNPHSDPFFNDRKSYQVWSVTDPSSKVYFNTWGEAEKCLKEGFDAMKVAFSPELTVQR